MNEEGNRVKAMMGLLCGATLSRHHKAKPVRWILTTEGFGCDIITRHCIHAIQFGQIEVVDVTQDPQIYRLTPIGLIQARGYLREMRNEFEEWCPALAGAKEADQ